jgi:anti-sigma factor RsiW
MACDLWRGRVEAYVDGELPASERRDFDLHLGNCTSCAAEALALLQQKRLLQAAGKRYTPSPQFRRRMESALQAGNRPASQGSWFRAWAPQLAMAVLLLVAVAAFFGWRQRSEREQLLSQVADLHVSDLASANPVDVVSTDRHTVKPWFQGRLPFSFDLPEFQNSPFTLLGGRVTYLEHEPGAHLLHQVRQHKISVFIFRNTGSLERLGGVADHTVLSFHVESWTRGGLRYFVVGDASPQDIQQLSALYKAVAAP